MYMQLQGFKGAPRPDEMYEAFFFAGNFELTAVGYS